MGVSPAAESGIVAAKGGSRHDPGRWASDDVFGRFGGEELLLILSGRTANRGLRAADEALNRADEARRSCVHRARPAGIKPDGWR